MTDDPKQQAQQVIDQLRERGNHVAADALARHLTPQMVGRALLFALRETCETLLTAVEAIDPVSQTMMEDLRLEVEKRLK